MSRRPLQHPVGRLAKAQNRMAPGGLLWSESPIPRRYSPRLRSSGDPAAGVIKTAPMTFRGVESIVGDGTLSIQFAHSNRWGDGSWTDPPITALVFTVFGWHVASFGTPVDGNGDPTPCVLAASGTGTYFNWEVLVIPFPSSDTQWFILPAVSDGADGLCLTWEHGWNGDPGTPLTVQSALSTGTTCPWPAYPAGTYSPAQFVIASPTGATAASRQALFARETPTDQDAYNGTATWGELGGPTTPGPSHITGECAWESWTPELTTTKTGMGSTWPPDNPANWFPSTVQWLTLAWGWDYTPPAAAE
jgi:hypothetical protein